MKTTLIITVVLFVIFALVSIAKKVLNKYFSNFIASKGIDMTVFTLIQDVFGIAAFMFLFWLAYCILC